MELKKFLLFKVVEASDLRDAQESAPCELDYGFTPDMRRLREDGWNLTPIDMEVE